MLEIKDSYNPDLQTFPHEEREYTISGGETYLVSNHEEQSYSSGRGYTETSTEMLNAQIYSDGILIYDGGIPSNGEEVEIWDNKTIYTFIVE